MFQIKYTEAIFWSNSAGKLLWFEIARMLIAVKKKLIYHVIYHDFQRTFVSYWSSDRGQKATLAAGLPRGSIHTVRMRHCRANSNGRVNRQTDGRTDGTILKFSGITFTI